MHKLLIFKIEVDYDHVADFAQCKGIVAYVILSD